MKGEGGGVLNPGAAIRVFSTLLKLKWDGRTHRLLLQVAANLRERIEIVHTHEFSSFLKHLFPVFEELLMVIYMCGGCITLTDWNW